MVCSNCYCWEDGWMDWRLCEFDPPPVWMAAHRGAYGRWYFFFCAQCQEQYGLRGVYINVEGEISTDSDDGPPELYPALLAHITCHRCHGTCALKPIVRCEDCEVNFHWDCGCPCRDAILGRWRGARGNTPRGSQRFT